MLTPTALALAAVALQQAPDTAYARLVREATTDGQFLPATVATLPDHPTVPSPLDHFGTIAGAPGVVHRSDELYRYYRALAAASPNVLVESLGRSEEGREMILVVIADPPTLAGLDDLKDAMAALADPRRTDAAARDLLVERAKPIYYLQGGLHSPEMGPPEMLTELAYRLAVGDDPTTTRIRERVVTLINPVAEPDGRDKQVDWYYRHTKGRPVWDDGFPRSAPYWGAYVYHDNNRDGLQLSQALTRAVNDVFFEWHPVVMHDLHESVPFLYVSTGTGPYNRHVDPVTIAEWQTLANWDIQQLTTQGLPGVWTWGFYDGWWPGYGIWVAINHNAIGRFYETFGNAGADTYRRDLRANRYAGDSVTSTQWYRAWPPSKTVDWSLRNNTNYMQAGVLASLDYASRHGRDLLTSFWTKGQNSLRRGRAGPPYGFLVPSPASQRDPRRVTYLVNQLLRHGIEVHRATDTLAGSFVVLANQPYRDFAVSLLTAQAYPPTAPHPPYDDVAWTLPLLYGVEVETIDDSAVADWRGLEPVADTLAWLGRAVTAPGGDTWLLRYRGQQELLPALYALAERERRSRAFAAQSAFTAADTTWPAGTVILERLTAPGAEWLARRFGLSLVAARPPEVARHPLDLPRIAVYHTWHSTQDEGWARYWLDQLGVPFTSIDKDDLRRGRLRQRFDVILVPNARGDARRWVHGVDRGLGPMPYTSTAAFPAHGTPRATEDMTGGPGFQGMAELERFVEGGGTVIAIANAGRLVAETGIVRSLDPHAPEGLFHPGSVVRVRARRPAHPILYGFPEDFHIFRGQGPLWRTAPRDRRLMVLQYGTGLLPDDEVAVARGGSGPESGEAGPDDPEADRAQPDAGYVLSGMVRRSEEIVGHGAIFDVPAGTSGRGRVVVFTFNPLHRYLNHHDAALALNAMLHWNDRVDDPPGAAGGS